MELECIVDFAGTADWRRRKAEEYPGDARNAKAAELLGHLAEQVQALEGSRLHRRLEELWSNQPKDIWPGCGETFSERVSEALRSVGLYSSPDNAAEFTKS
jgi:hypothetical protein